MNGFLRNWRVMQSASAHDEKSSVSGLVRPLKSLLTGITKNGDTGHG